MIEIDNANLPLKAFIHNKRYFLCTSISNYFTLRMNITLTAPLDKEKTGQNMR